MERCAGPCWGTGSWCERKKRREEERTERLFTFHLELPSAGDPWTTPPGSCVACGRTYNAAISYCISILLQLTAATIVIRYRVCRHLLSDRAKVAGAYSRPPLAAYRSCLVCLFYTLSCAAAFRRDRLYSLCAHSALFINTQTQEVLFIRQSDRDQLGERRMPAQ